MRMEEIIRKKRDGGELSGAEIRQFVAELTEPNPSEEQIAAMAMAIYFRSMTETEIAALTLAMAKSGDVIDWSTENLPGPVADKHSTGGVGDKVSLALAPIMAACGCFIPMISGRGLGHSGGTLDKLESIPGYNAQPGIDDFKRVVKTVGCAIIGQTGALAPADKRLYAIRDVTATVESIPLITASILSKKIAGGNEALVMDIKVGSGAFMPSLEAARALAASIVETGQHTGLKTRALITDMNEPLGRSAGNAVEIDETVKYLTGARREQRLDAIVKALCAEMLTLTKIETDLAAARERVEKTIESGQAAEVFGKMVAALGGPADFIERSDHYLKKAKLTAPVYPPEDGYLAKVDARRIGEAIINLGGGRARAEDRIDPAVGFTEIARIGERLDKDRPLAMAHALTEDSLERAIAEYKGACLIAPAPPEERPVIYETIT